jgi:hypothetical protein
MSHFTLVAILPKSVTKETDEEKIWEVVDLMMSKYDENRQVDEYEIECYCVRSKINRAAMDHAQAVAESTAGATREELRQRAGDEIKRTLTFPGHDANEKQIHEWSAAGDVIWDKHVKVYSDAYDQAYASFLASNPHLAAPNPNCSECGGTGIDKTTYNPDSQWDWWDFGGRWNGEMVGKKEGDNEGGFNFDDRYRTLARNMCLCKEIVEGFIPWAILGPQGEWIENRKMGWFGMSSPSNQSPTVDWPTFVKGMYAECAEHVSVQIDCHI